MRVGSLLVLTSLLLAACSGAPASNDPASSSSPATAGGGAAATSRTTAPPSVTLLAEALRGAATAGAISEDTELDAFLASTDLKKTLGARTDELLELLHLTRATAIAGLKPASVKGGSRLASVPTAAEVKSFLFGATLAAYLDPLTAGGGARDPKPDFQTTTQDGPTMTVTTNLNTTSSASAVGSRVTASLHLSSRTKIVDRASGAVLVDVSEDRTLVGAIDVCPNAGGIAPATLEIQGNYSSANAGGSVTTTTTRTTRRSNTFSGRVNDQAFLSGVTMESQNETSWQTTGSTPNGVKLSASTSLGANENGLGGRADASATQGTWSMSGDATDANVREATLTMAIDALNIDPAWKEAQRLWRNGRCVVVMAPEYNAETPLAANKQEDSQHDEEVDQNSDTKFALRLRQRFGGGAVSASVEAGLVSGQRKLEPSRIDAPASLTYTAPDEPDKKATARMRSTSKRGIGTLVLAFHTTGKHLTLNISGIYRMGTPDQAAVANLTIGPADFTKRDDTTWEASAPFQATTHQEPPSDECPNARIVERGKMDFTATVEKRGDASFWVVHNELSGNTTLVVTGCEDPASLAIDVGGALAGLFVNAVGDISIPVDGGTVRLQGSMGFGLHTASGTATGTVRK